MSEDRFTTFLGAILLALFMLLPGIWAVVQKWVTPLIQKWLAQ